MKKVIMYLGFHYYFGPMWKWHEEDGWNEYGEYVPYYVEIPEGFHLAQSRYGIMMYFRDGGNIGYELANSCNSENGHPVLVGGSPVECIDLKVLGPVEQ